MNVIERIGECGIVPVVVMDSAQNAVDTANALLSGGIGLMEVTLRTEAGLLSIREVAKKCSNICVGAGTVITLEQCKASVEVGAKFIVSPGFDSDVVKWCVDNGVTLMPGCVTPTEIIAALSLGINILKFFPANIYGGLIAMKALSGPFGNVKFVPTGGVSAGNLAEYAAAPFIHAIGGSWLCDKNDIANKDYSKITALCRQAVEIVHKARERD